MRIVCWRSGKDLLAPDATEDAVFQDDAFEDVTDRITASDATSITLDLGRERTFCGFVMTPDPDDPEGLPLRYAISRSDDGENWQFIMLDEGFENIQANPVPQRVIMKKTTTRYVRFASFQQVKDGVPMKVRAFAILKQD